MIYGVTGAGGFIGQHIVKYLKGEHDVYHLKRQRFFSFDFIPKIDPYVIIHLSAYGNHSNQTNSEEIINRNIYDLLVLLNRTVDTSLHKFYNISTSAIQLPKQTVYSCSKRLGELIIEARNDERFVNIRPYSVYGPGEAAHRFIPTVIRALETGETIQLDEHATHDWIHVLDFIEAMFNGHTMIGSGKQFTNLDIVWMLEDVSKKKLSYEKAKLRSYDTREWVCEKGVPHRPIYEGLKQTYEHFMQKDRGNKQEA